VSVYDLHAAARPTPLVVEVPHAGLEVPADLAGPLVADERERRRDADLFADRVYAGAPAAGAPLLVARVSRYVCDLNRDPDDVDAAAVADHLPVRPSAPRGFVWRLTTDGKPCLARPLAPAEWLARRDRVWAPYHDRLRALLGEARARHGFALLVAGHSMPSVGRPAHHDRGRRRSDVVVGVRGGASCAPAARDLVVGHFRACGYSTAVDDPYRGGATTARYGRPGDGLHAVQIELCRALYMDEDRLEIHDGDLDRLRAHVDALLGALAGLAAP
jgi:N-formylglutamate amidohydrolase